LNNFLFLFYGLAVVQWTELTWQASFYATETATTRYETVYYSHDAWARTTEPHLKKLQGELLEELDEVSQGVRKTIKVCVSKTINPAEPTPSSKRATGRMCGSPYSQACRVQADCQPWSYCKLPLSQIPLTPETGSGGRSQKGTSANDVLKGVHQVLTFEKVGSTA
jgi:hypothetical protein